jgi:hypothetical protein
VVGFLYVSEGEEFISLLDKLLSIRCADWQELVVRVVAFLRSVQKLL